MTDAPPEPPSPAYDAAVPTRSAALTGADAATGSTTDSRTTVVCLVRHGETDWNSLTRLQGREDIPLNARGRDQARRSGVALRAAGPWDLMLASPLGRAWETATIIAGHVGVASVVAVPELVERDYGAASGLIRAEAARRFGDGPVPGQERPEAVAARALPALTAWVDRNPGARMVVVAHGGVISAVLSAVTGGAIAMAVGELANACLNVLHHDGTGWTVRCHNSVDHLADG